MYQVKVILDDGSARTYEERYTKKAYNLYDEMCEYENVKSVTLMGVMNDKSIELKYFSR